MRRQGTSRSFFRLSLLSACAALALAATGARAQEAGGDLGGGAGIFRPKNPETTRRRTGTGIKPPTVRPSKGRGPGVRPAAGRLARRRGLDSGACAAAGRLRVLGPEDARAATQVAASFLRPRDARERQPSAQGEH